MRKKGNAHYYVANQRWLPLGTDYLKALVKYRELDGQAEGAATLSQLVDNALAAMTNLKPGTVREFARAASHIKAAFPSFTPADLEPHHVATYLAKRSAKVSANREITFLSACWDLARSRGWTSLPNPCAGAPYNPEKPRKRVATKDEIRALLYEKQADESWLRRDHYMADAVEWTLRTAMRQADLIGFKLNQLTDEGVVLRPEKTADSTGAQLLFEWTPEMLELAERIKKRRRRVGSVYLFPTKSGQPFTGNGFRSMWKKWFDKCGVAGLTWHDLRRTALNLRKREGGTEAAKDLGAHSSLLTTEGYLSNIDAKRVQPVKLPT